MASRMDRYRGNSTGNGRSRKNQSLYDIKFYENLISKIDYNIEKVDIDENELSNWSINYEETKKEKN